MRPQAWRQDMADFDAATRPEGGDGRYRVRLAEDWDVWGPVGGYVAGIALRAMGAESALERPASFACQYLSVGRFEPVEIEVALLRRGRSSEALGVLRTKGPWPASPSPSVSETSEGLQWSSDEGDRPNEGPRAKGLGTSAEGDLAEALRRQRAGRIPSLSLRPPLCARSRSAPSSAGHQRRPQSAGRRPVRPPSAGPVPYRH